MRAFKIFLLGAIVVSGLGITASQAECTDADGSHTAAGSSKDDCGAVHCGSAGMVPTGTDIRAYANNPSDGPQVEACNDTGSPNTQGRAVVQVSKSTPGARVVLDTDDGQPFPPGYINVQVSPTKPGVWCSRETDPTSQSDGYARTWANPGPDGGLSPAAANCAPNF